jgi:WD40 repeat protein
MVEDGFCARNGPGPCHFVETVISGAIVAVMAGAADGTVKVWDSRSLGGNRATALYTFAVHTEAVMHVEWCPHRSGGLVRI